MSTAALDSQHRWRCRLQDLSPHLQPPAPEVQLPKSSTPPSPLPQQNKTQVSPCFPVNVPPLLNPGGFQFCLLPWTPVFGLGLPRSVVTQSSSEIQSVKERDLQNLSTSDCCQTTASLQSPHHCLQISQCLQSQAVQSNNCDNPLKPSDLLNPHSQESRPQSKPSSILGDISEGSLSQTCSCSPKVIQVVASSSNYTSAPFSMHAQATSGNLAVSAVENFDVNRARCPSEGFLLDSSVMCRNGASKNSGTRNSNLTPNIAATTTTASFSVYPALSGDRNVASSSVPRSLESYPCHSVVSASLPSANTSTVPLTARCPPSKSNVNESNSVYILSTNKPCSKSDSHLSPGSLSLQCNPVNSSPQQNKQHGTRSTSPFEGALSITSMGERLTTEEDSSSFDSGQESSDSAKKSHCHKSRKKRQGESHPQQDNNSVLQEKKSGTTQGKEDSIALVSQSDDNSNQEGWKVVTMPFTKSNSRGNVGGKCNLSGSCCPRRRLIDDEGFIRRAACICVNKEETKVLLISSKKDRCAWLVPGGGLEAGEDPASAATREAWEEAGVLGHIARYLGLFESYHHSGLKKHRTAVYIFTVTEERNQFPEARLGRTRQWFSLEEALLHLTRHRPLQSAYLRLMMMSTLKVASPT